MKLTNIKYFLAGFALMSMFSCDSLLDFDPENAQTSDDFYDGVENVYHQNLMAVYNHLYTFEVHSFPYIGLTEIIADNADKGSDPADTGRDKHLIDALDIDKYNMSFNELWRGYYMGITKVNKFLSKVPGFKIDESEKARLAGEVKFLRAYYYFNLVRWFGDIPKVTIAPDDDQSNDAIINARTRAPKAEIYNLIIEDLNAAINSCPSKSALSEKEMGRATSTAAKALLAKVYLYNENWAQVVRLTGELQGEGLALFNDYDVMFREAGENGVESIFEVQCRGAQPSLGIGGYCEIQSARGLLGWGFNVPTQKFVDSYEANDKRKTATVITTGETLWDGLFMDPAIIPNFLPYSNKKAYVSATKETYDGGRWVTNKNLRVLRYAEVLLMKAEAHARMGATTGEGLTALNQVRVRAGLPALTSMTVESVWKERRYELAFEHDRWFDLIRTKEAPKAMRADGKTWTEKLWLFPIPQEQVDLSGGLLTQNPGY